MPEPLRVAAITAGRRDPGARFRVGQFAVSLRDHDVDLAWLPAPIAKYPPRWRPLRPLWLPAAVAGRVPATVASWRADVTLLAREMVSTLVTLEPLTRRPRVLDVDDAIWLRRGGGFARRLAGLVDLVIAGNQYVGAWFADRGARVEILPTAVDVARFSPGSPQPGAVQPHHLTIGWCGTSGNQPALLAIEDALARVLQARPRARVQICSDRPPRWRSLPAARWDFVPWSAAAEVAFFRNLDIGLMPLRDDPWSRGKCAYKMLLYLACGVPAVVSPVGMSAVVLGQAQAGIGAVSESAWTDALIDLLDDDGLRAAMSRAGRKLVVECYSVDSLAPRLAALLRSVVTG
ncbi:MAG: glycosyltransferase [Candidatus Krumholzibacteria bacterium]|jgi:glycosyltransferase involved in cell wall biosynthesis|nr:glycosyltransferase [Candidatus Krumholzibacteria bacterium]